MTKLECDLQTLALITLFLKTTGKTINDFVPDYNKEKVKEIAREQKMFDSEELALKALSKMTKQVYQRVEKKFTT